MQVVEVINDESAKDLYIVTVFLTRFSILDKILQLDKNEYLLLETIRTWAKQLISVLYTCHVEAKVVHRDIKPDNLVLNKQEELVLIDFGLSRQFEDDNDIMKNIAGTCLYYAPEVVQTGLKNKVIRGR